MTIVLIGGGWDDPSVYAPFLSAAGPDPVIACVVVDEGDGAQYAERFADALRRSGPVRPRAALIAPGQPFHAAVLHGADGLLVCGGLTPAYAEALAPAGADLRRWLAAGRPYAGFSAGAAVAATRAIVGGYRLAGRAVCPADAAEDLEEVTVVDGVGLTPFALDVHAAQWGTLGRLVAAVRGGLVESGIALDENTALVLQDGRSVVVGTGAVHVVTRGGTAEPTSVGVTSFAAGARDVV